MARIRNFDQTRTLLIETAAQLFATQGYDRTSVESIIGQAGVSKGAFYHHFSSKDQILDAVTSQLDVEAADAIKAAVGERSVGALARLNRFFVTSRSWSLTHFSLVKEVIDVLFREENVRMRRKVEKHAAALIEPLLADIIRQGNEEGVFDLPEPDESARTILQMAWALREAQVKTLSELGLTDAAFDVAQRRLNLYVVMLERMLAVPAGSIERLSLDPSRAAIMAAQEAASAPAGADAGIRR
jgi:AcrR family transcriptional regulator